MQNEVQSICIVGTGFRGLGVFERIYAYAKKNRSTKPIQVHLIDPTTDGPEQYNTRLPDYLLLNIVCGQVSLFPDAVSVPGCPPTTGPSLYEWVRERRLRLTEDGFTIGDTGRDINYGDFLPRRLLGEYLLWFREVIKKEAGLLFEIFEHKAKATNIAKDAYRYAIQLSNSEVIISDYLFITVGQISEPILSSFGYKSKTKYISQPYPLPEQLETVKAEERIAICGLGLTAFDAILTLTIGRGGKIVVKNGVENYIPSGKEPQIVAFSRSGLPFFSRPSLGAPLKYEPIVFNQSAIDGLRNKVGMKLDYDRDILPLIFTEMRVAYHRAKYGRDYGWEKTQKLHTDFRYAFQTGNLEKLLNELDSHDSFVFSHKDYYFEFYDTSAMGFADSTSYENWIRRWLENDLKESRSGTPLSPIKAALEVLREFRDIIRYAVDFGGLTNESAERFFSFHSETLNRIGVGPQKEHTAIVLALMKAGILRICLGPSPEILWDNYLKYWKFSSKVFKLQQVITVDWIYQGSINRRQHIGENSSIVGAMAHQGLLRRYYPESAVNYAVDIDHNFHPINQNGIANERIWVLGLLCEGATFYNGYVTSPDKFVRSQFDADCAVSSIFSQIMQ